MSYFSKPEAKITGLEDINYRISSFIHTFTNILFVVLAMAIAGIVMKFMEMNGGSYVFIFSIIVLTLMFLVQIGLSFFYVVSRIKLALLGAFGSLALALGFLAILFRYQNWTGWQLMFLISGPIFFITAFILGRYLGNSDNLHKNHKNFLNRNLLIPYILVAILGLGSFFLKIDNANGNWKGVEVTPEISEDSTRAW